MGIYSGILRPIAFSRDAEHIHDLAIRAAERAGASRCFAGPWAPVTPGSGTALSVLWSDCAFATR